MRYPLDHGSDSRALYWAQRFAEESAITPEEREEFRKWLEHPEHVERFLECEVIARVAEDSLANRPAREVDDSISRSRTLLGFMPRMACAALIVLGGFIPPNPHSLDDKMSPPGVTFETQTGKSRTVKFGEGSVAYLNTRTQLRWLGQQENRRRVELLAGEATFEVARDERRPFAVLLDGSEILVKGTRFNVYRKPDGQILVTVYEGSLEVRRQASTAMAPPWVRKLSANEQMEYGLSGPAPEPHPADLLLANWRSGMLQLPRDGAPLPEVVDELERYTDKSIVLGDARLAAITVGGSYSTRDVPATLGDLARALEFRVFESGDAFVLDNPTYVDRTRDDDADDQQ